MAIAAAGSAARLWVCPSSQRSWEPGDRRVDPSTAALSEPGLLARRQCGGHPLAAGVLVPQGILLSPAVGAVLRSLSTVILAVNAQLLRRAAI